MSLPENYSIRRMVSSDYDRGVLTTLEALTVVGTISKYQFQALVNKWESLELNNGKFMYNPTVIVDGDDTVVATGMILIEEKLIHQCGLVGHIEDIAVRKDQQGKQLGKILINHLTQIGRDAGCYKIILDCDPKNVGFYEKCGYKNNGLEMEIRQ